MNKSIIEQLRALGAVAAHPNDRWVTSSRGKPSKVTLAHPLFLDKKKLRTGDKIAILDTQDNIAFLCRARSVEYGGLSETPVIDLAVLKSVELT